jgi:hypothetical protein
MGPHRFLEPSEELWNNRRELPVPLLAICIQAAGNVIKYRPLQTETSADLDNLANSAKAATRAFTATYYAVCS